MPRLTAAQVDTLRDAADGKTMREIASERQVSVATVKTHLDRARSSLVARSVTHAVALALRKGLIE